MEVCSTLPIARNWQFARIENCSQDLPLSKRPTSSAKQMYTFSMSMYHVLFASRCLSIARANSQNYHTGITSCRTWKYVVVSCNDWNKYGFPSIVIPFSPFVCYLHKYKYMYRLGQKVVRPQFEAIKSIWMIFLCFKWAEIDIKCTCACSPMKSILHWQGFHFNAKWDCRSPKPQVRLLFPKSALALWQVRIDNCIFFSILTDCSNNAPFNPYRC